MRRLLFSFLALCAIPLAVAWGEGPARVVFSRDSGDEFFYELTPGVVAQGDRIVFSGEGIVKGFAAPFRSSAKKECGAWAVSAESKAGKVVFEAKENAVVEQPVDGFILVGRMGASRSKDGALGTLQYTYETREGPSKGELPGPAAR